jgi:hypothetical protein
MKPLICLDRYSFAGLTSNPRQPRPNHLVVWAVPSFIRLTIVGGA